MTVYILVCQSPHHCYVGITQDLGPQIAQHLFDHRIAQQELAGKGASFVRGVNRLLYATIEEAKWGEVTYLDTLDYVVAGTVGPKPGDPMQPDAGGPNETGSDDL